MKKSLSFLSLSALFSLELASFVDKLPLRGGRGLLAVPPTFFIEFNDPMEGGLLYLPVVLTLISMSLALSVVGFDHQLQFWSILTLSTWS